MPHNADFDLSLWDSSGNRTGGWTWSDFSARTQLANSSYSGYSANPETAFVSPPVAYGTWRTGCCAFTGSGEYTIRVTISE